MKIIIIFILLLPRFVFAGEIRGTIFTNYQTRIRDAGSNTFFLKKKAIKKEIDSQKQRVRVKSVRYYEDDSLLRCGVKIYRIEHQMRRYIKSLEELAKYCGKEIIDVGENEISGFILIEYRDGDLIRCKDMRVYVLKGLYKKHILNLNELQKDYFARKIFAVDCDTVKKYKKVK